MTTSRSSAAVIQQLTIPTPTLVASLSLLKKELLSSSSDDDLKKHNKLQLNFFSF